MNKIEQLFEKDCYIVDILPERVDEAFSDSYQKIEEYYLEDKQIHKIYDSFFEILFRLNCYFEMKMSTDGEDWIECCDHLKLKELLYNCVNNDIRKTLMIYIEKEESLICLNGDFTYMSVFAPSERLLGIIRKLAENNGLFVFKGIN